MKIHGKNILYFPDGEAVRFPEKADADRSPLSWLRGPIGWTATGFGLMGKDTISTRLWETTARTAGTGLFTGLLGT